MDEQTALVRSLHQIVGVKRGRRLVNFLEVLLVAAFSTFPGEKIALHCRI